MAISLESFQRAATIGGRITLDKRQDDGLNASNGQMGGKSVAWVKDTWPSSAVKEENRAAIQSFVGSVRAKYGDLLGDLAMARLAGDIQTGRPLTEQTITMIVTASDKALVDLAKMNEASARTAAKSDDPQKPGSFGQVFDQVTRAMGSSVKISDLDPGRLADARLAMEAGIKAETSQHGIPNLALVDDDVAQAIATREIKKLLGVDARDTMSRELTTPGDGTTPFDKAFAKELSARGFTQLTHKAFELGPLLQATRSAIVEASFNPNENAHTRPVDRAKADAILEQQIKRFLDGQQDLLLKVKDLARDDQVLEMALTNVALTTEGITPAMLDKLAQSRQVAETALKTLANPNKGLDNQVKALKDLSTAIGKAAGDLGLDEAGTARFRDALLTLAKDTAKLNDQALDNARNALSSTGLADVQDAIAAGNRPSLPEATRKAADDLVAVLESLRQAVGAEPPSRAPIPTLALASPEALKALKQHGVDLQPWSRVVLSTAQQAINDKARELAAGNPKHEAALLRLAKQDRDMTPETLETTWQARGAAEKAFKAIATSATLTDQVGALKELTAAINEAVDDLDLHGTDANRFRSTVMALASDTTGLNMAAQDLLELALGSRQFMDVLDGLDLASQSQDLPPETREAARDLSDQFGRLHA